MTFWTRGILKSVWRVWLDTNQGAFAISRRSFDWNLWMMCIFVLLAHSHNSHPYITHRFDDGVVNEQLAIEGQA
jgi:hypothetical protein